jgi:hypothetical protein
VEKAGSVRVQRKLLLRLGIGRRLSMEIQNISYTPEGATYTVFKRGAEGNMVELGKLFTGQLPNLKETIKEIVFNPPCTIINWSDKSKTIVRCGDNDTFDHEKGIALCVMKKVFGNKGSFNEVFHKWIPEPETTPTPNGIRVLNLDEIYIRHSMHESHPNPDKIHKCYSYYRKHGRFDRDIIVDENNVLVDGYCAYLVAKMFDEEYVRVVQES